MSRQDDLSGENQALRERLSRLSEASLRTYWENPSPSGAASQPELTICAGLLRLPKSRRRYPGPTA